MKKYILPLVAVMFLTAVANAQTTKKATPMKAVTSSNQKITAKPVSHADTTKPKTKTGMTAATKKKHHKKKTSTKAPAK